MEPSSHPLDTVDSSLRACATAPGETRADTLEEPPERGLRRLEREPLPAEACVRRRPAGPAPGRTLWGVMPTPNNGAEYKLADEFERCPLRPARALPSGNEYSAAEGLPGLMWTPGPSASAEDGSSAVAAVATIATRIGLENELSPTERA